MQCNIHTKLITYTQETYGHYFLHDIETPQNRSKIGFICSPLLTEFQLYYNTLSLAYV